MRMGVTLGEKILRERPDHDIDVVIPIPDTSRDSALEIANVLGVKYREGFIKNRYVGRTFIMPGQGERAKSVKRKLNPIPLEFRGRVVLLVDDSIVRGTTSKQIIQMARDAGARKVYSPRRRRRCATNIYGIDSLPPTTHAHGRSEKEIEQFSAALARLPGSRRPRGRGRGAEFPAAGSTVRASAAIRTGIESGIRAPAAVAFG